MTRKDDGHVAVLTFSDSRNFNSFDPKSLQEIDQAIRGVIEDPKIRAWVITGSEKVFSTGANVQEFKKNLDSGTIVEFVLAATGVLHPLMAAMHRSTKPCIAAVNGVAAGGGLGLALMADSRIGTGNARFAAGYFGIGASPDGGSTWAMPRLVGTQRARLFFLNNEVMNAETAMETGLMDELVSADHLLTRAIELAIKWGSWSTHSLSATKRLLDAQEGMHLESVLEMERGLIASSSATPMFKEGVTSFLQKRTPKFRPDS